MSWFGDHGWLTWVGLALVLGAIEAASVAFVFVMLAGGALAGAVAAAVGAPLAVQVIAAVGVAVALLLMVRPIVTARFMVTGGRSDIGAVAQVGRSALVLKTVTEHDGRVKLGGETWSARTAPDTPACLPGQEVRVVSIEGATAIVSNVADGRKSE